MLKPSPRTVVPCLLTALLAACAVPGQQGNGPRAAAPAQTAAPAPAATPSHAHAEPAQPPSPAQQAQAQKLAAPAIELLAEGKEDEARAQLEQALAQDPGNKLAVTLMRQITADPVQTLGRESFPYTVKPNDTLSQIAGRFMGDIYSFYILARYNDIKVPRQVAGGQVLRIPGKAPAAGVLDAPAAAPVAAARGARGAGDKANAAAGAASVPAGASTPSAPASDATPGERAMRNGEVWERSNRLDRALEEYKRAASLDQPGAQAKAAAVRKKLIDRHTLAARTAFARQDLAGAIQGWDNVLALDPSNETAKLEKQKAVALKAKVDQLK